MNNSETTEKKQEQQTFKEKENLEDYTSILYKIAQVIVEDKEDEEDEEEKEEEEEDKCFTQEYITKMLRMYLYQERVRMKMKELEDVTNQLKELIDADNV